MFAMPRWFNKEVVAIFVVVGFSYGAYRFFAPGGAHDMPHGGAPVSVAEVLERDVQQWNEFSGRLVAVNQVEIRPRVSGTIEEIHFKSGALVKKGDLLFTLDQRPYLAEVNRAQGTLASAEAQVKLTASELARAEHLIKDKVISQSEFDSRKNAFNVNEAIFKSAKAALESARINLDYTQIRSPITGRISRAEITKGNLIEAGINTPVLATVISNAPIYADFEVDENTFLRYAHLTKSDTKEVNQIPVMMGLATESDTPHKGYIESFDNRLNSASGTIRVRAVFANTDGTLVPGLFARMKLGDAGNQHVLLITDRAIGTDQNKKFVLVVGDDNKVAYREIKLGNVVNGLRVVREGLIPGEKIVVNGLQRARPGSEITPELVSMEIKPTVANVGKEQV
ncbi:MAG: efflux RND transporter periplasmic adaptor subunit [Gammaproteobacteria bacterium]|nr:efflux RND transporter periplasmic adaptor subunit [Gammaproteobacteria bacterium]